MFIRFGRWLDLEPDPSDRMAVGPSFTRWLPDGEADSIELLSTSTMSLKVWFERFGIVDDEYIRFEHKVRKVDPGVMARQGRLDAGPLYGLLTLPNVDDATATAIREKRQEDPLYMELAKQIVKYAVPKLRRFVMLLRTVYGQHWLEDVPEWDSRKQSLGSYCQDWGMHWSFDQGMWEDFEPNRPFSVLKGTWGFREDYSCYITREDWSKLGDLVRSDYQPSDAVEICNRSRLLLNKGHIRYALIEIVSALEIAVLQYVHRKTQGPVLNDIKNGFEQMSAKGRMALVGYLVLGIKPDDIQFAAEAIEHRNRMIHEGADVPSNVTRMIEASMRIIVTLLDGPPHKCPPNDGTNRLFPADDESTSPTLNGPNTASEPK